MVWCLTPLSTIFQLYREGQAYIVKVRLIHIFKLYTPYLCTLLEIYRNLYILYSTKMDETWMKQGWNMNETGMKHEWNRNETGMKHEWNRDETWMKHEWNMNETWMKHEWNRDETGMKQGWNRDETWMNRDETGMKHEWNRDGTHFLKRKVWRYQKGNKNP
jgi:hypothetical protein